MNRIEFRRSPMKAVGLLLGSIALVAASIVTTRNGDGALIRAVGWIGVLFCSFAILKTIRDLFSTDTVYLFDDRGIDDRTCEMGLIPWSAITRIEIVSIHGTRMVLLSLDRPADYMARVSSVARGLAAINRSAGWGDWSLAFVGLSPGIDEAQKFIEETMSRRE